MKTVAGVLLGIAALALGLAIKGSVEGRWQAVGGAMLIFMVFGFGGYALLAMDQGRKVFALPAGAIFVGLGIILMIGRLRDPGAKRIGTILLDLLIILIGVALCLKKQKGKGAGQG